MNLWIGNLASEVTDDDLKAFVTKYGCPAPERIERVTGDGSRPAAVLFFSAANDKAVYNAQLAPARHVLERQAAFRADHAQ